MAEFLSQKFKSKSGSEVTIRSATKEDAIGVLDLSSRVMAEEIYMLTTSSEFKMSLEAEERWIESHLSKPNDLILLAEMDTQIVGMLDFSNGRRERIAHTGEFGMSIAKEFREMGVGTLLMTALIQWASENPTIEKIGLQVHSNNKRAIGLYRKMGFEVEGIRKRDLKYGKDQYIDTMVMGLILKE